MRRRRWPRPIPSPRSSSDTRASGRSRPRPSRPSPAASRPSGARKPSRACSSSSRAISCASASSTASRASTAATPRRYARSRSRSACCRVLMARRCSPPGKPRRWGAPPRGTPREGKITAARGGGRREPFMLHYNFPPFSVGETGMMGSPKRREIGHGNLARRSLKAVMPDMATFPYVVRIVSEILESNGSSSMASVCGTSLALMDAGVAIKAPVAGVAMGLVLEGNRYQVLTDILGDEDHLGDMDFKVAGTKEGVTALQMDIKVEGVTPEIMRVALDQAREGRLHILAEMNKVIREPREKMSEWAPSIITLKIDPEKIRGVIGKGGAVIRQITEETGTTIDIENDGTVKIASVSGAAGREAQRGLEPITDAV